MKIFPQNIDCIKGAKRGPCVAVMGAVHGNERIGGAVIARLLHEVKPEKLHGDLILILGNPAAYAANQRFIDCDLNRLFSAGRLGALRKKPLSSLNCEEKRALEIAPYLQRAEYFLDIHSTIKPSAPFVYCDAKKAHLKLACLFGARYIVSAAPECKISDLISCADSYVNQNGGIGITYEAGWHKTSAVLEKVMGKIYLFLQAAGSFEQKNPFESSAAHTKHPAHVEIYDCVVPHTRHFHFKKDFANFDVVQEGETIAEDQGKLFKARMSSFIIFPKTDIVPGAPACCLGT